MASRTMIVGVDGSEGSARAVEWCAATAGALGAEVVAVCVVVPPVSFIPPTGAFPADDQEHERVGKELGETWCAPLRDAGVPHRSIVVDGTPADTLLEAADEVDADLVVVGRRGHRGLAELLLGGVASALAHRCRRPLVIVPATT
jgi:nucleotide-binding universal stress UspA family protein